MDYRLEAKNTLEFKAAMEKRGLNAVTAPSVVSELSTSKVLVTEWSDFSHSRIISSIFQCQI